jgi:hypothetical protein
MEIAGQVTGLPLFLKNRITDYSSHHATVSGPIARYALLARRLARRYLAPGTLTRDLLLLALGLALGAALVLSTRPEEPTGVAVPSHSDVRILVSTSYLARQIEAGAGALGIRHLRLRSAPPSVLRADMQLSAAWFTVPASLQLQPTARQGRLQLRVLSAKVVGVPVPVALAQLLVDALNGSTRRILGAQARVVGVRVVPQGVDMSVNYRR